MRKKTAACLMLFVFALVTIDADANCESPDNLNYVSGSSHCLAIDTHSPADSSTKTLVVMLHGDLSRGGGISYPIEGACRLW